MRVALLTREYPPSVYGGAGVHAEFLTRELRRFIGVDVHCFGDPRNEDGVHAYSVPPHLADANSAVQAFGVDLEIAAAVGSANLLHSHTWYTNLAGVIGSQLHGIPHVLTAHSLEPRRPWKAEQLGGGYRLSSWAERLAYESANAIIAVSAGMRADVLAAYPSVDPATVHVIHNGIDTTLYAPSTSDEALQRHGIDQTRPYVLFVGRIARQKGLAHLLAAAATLDPAIQLVLCAGAPDTPEIAAATEATVASLAETRSGVVWIREMLPREQVRELLTHASVFACPSVYEPQGIVNLEAMACGTAVVASAVGGIPEVVNDTVTGTLVPYDPASPRDFEAGLADAINVLCADSARAEAMGKAGRERAIAAFSWATVAQRTVGLYRSLLGD